MKFYISLALVNGTGGLQKYFHLEKLKACEFEIPDLFMKKQTWSLNMPVFSLVEP